MRQRELIGGPKSLGGLIQSLEDFVRDLQGLPGAGEPGIESHLQNTFFDFGPGRTIFERHFDIQRQGAWPAQRCQTCNGSQAAGAKVKSWACPDLAGQDS